jgi:hypothetical protein
MGNKISIDEIRYYSIMSGQQRELIECPLIENYTIWFTDDRLNVTIDHLYLHDENICLLVIKQHFKNTIHAKFILPSIYVTSYGKIIYTTNIDDELLIGKKNYNQTITFDNIPDKNNNNIYLSHTGKEQFKIKLFFDIHRVEQKIPANFYKYK